MTDPEPTHEEDLHDQVERLLSHIRPFVQADGGDVELVKVRPDGHVLIRFHGACIGCPSSEQTLHAGIENQLKAHVPGVSGVEAVE